MATRKHSSHKSHKSHKKSHKTHKTASHNHESHNITSALCPKCKKNVKLASSEVVSFKVNGHSRKRLAGVGECGHKVSRFLKSTA